MRTSIQRVAGITALLLSVACSKSPDTAATTAPTQPQTAQNRPGFVNKVWEVSLSTGVTPGMLYVFLSDGTLVVASPNSTAALGGWTYKNGAMTMTEESQEYKVDILGLSADEFRIRSHHPGGSLEISLMPAKTPPLTP